MYDDLHVLVGTADESGTSNGIVNAGRIRVHKVVLSHADGSGILSVALHNQTTVTGTPEILLSTNAITAADALCERHVSEDFFPPVTFDVGMSINITGSGTYRIYYTQV